MLLYPTDMAEDELSFLTPVVAVCVSLAIEELFALPTQIKWVNDLLIDERKICGILCERYRTARGKIAVIIGVGINIHQRQFADAIAIPATSIDMELQKRQKHFSGDEAAGKLTERIWETFAKTYERWMAEKETANGVKKQLWQEYRDRLVNIGRSCRVLAPQGEYEAVVEDIDKAGRLIVRRDDGSKVTIDAGEVSVRGKHGYI